MPAKRSTMTEQPRNLDSLLTREAILAREALAREERAREALAREAAAQQAAAGTIAPEVQGDVAGSPAQEATIDAGAFGRESLAQETVVRQEALSQQEALAIGQDAPGGNGPSETVKPLAGNGRSGPAFEAAQVHDVAVQDTSSEPALGLEAQALPVALRIQDIVRANPGIHFRALGRAAALHSTGQLRHHLDRLSRRGLLCEVADGRYRRYFPASQSADLQPQLARLSRPLPRRIVRLLSQAPMGRTALRRQLGCADSTLGYHLQRMLQQGDVQQQRDHRGAQYALADPERVRRILRVQDGMPDEPQVRAPSKVVPSLPGFAGFAGNLAPEVFSTPPPTFATPGAMASLVADSPSAVPADSAQ